MYYTIKYQQKPDNMVWKINYLNAVEDWLDSLTERQLKSVVKELKLLELCGNTLKLPHSHSPGGGLFELRERRFGLRLYYYFQEGQAILLLFAGDKTSQAKDIKKSRELLKKY